MKINRGQISTEYLIVVAFISFSIISILVVSLFYLGIIQDKLKLNNLESFVNKIISSAESTFYSGQPSKITINAYLPSGIESIEILNKEIVFNVSTSSGLNIISFSSDVPLSGNLTNNEGLKIIKITAESDKVVILE